MNVYGICRLEQRAQAQNLLAYACRMTWGFSELPEWSCLPDGKPVFSDHPDCHFNVSHSGSFALCAVDDAPVGVDIQRIRPTWREALIQRTCSTAELDWLNQQPNRARGFTLLWSMKESRVKWDGMGLQIPIHTISVPVPPVYDGCLLWENRYVQTYTGDSWCACVCGTNRPPTEIQWVDEEIEEIKKQR